MEMQRYDDDYIFICGYCMKIYGNDFMRIAL